MSHNTSAETITCRHCGDPIAEMGDGDWIHEETQRIACDGSPEEWVAEGDPKAEPDPHQFDGDG